MRIGDVCKFTTDGMNHIAKVEVVKMERLTWHHPTTGEITETRELYTCRRLNNGSVVLAWQENLTLEK